MENHNEIGWLALSLRWLARFISAGYLAFFLFMLIGHLIPGGDVFGQLTLRESLAFVFVGVYFVGNLISWKAEAVGGLVGVVGVLGFIVTATPHVHLPAYMVVPCLLFLASSAASASAWFRVRL